MQINIRSSYDSFRELRENNAYYVDKTEMIEEYLVRRFDKVVMFTRPRRFGKSLMLDTVRTFFSSEFAGGAAFFQGLEVWKDETLQSLQGTLPVISLSFSNIKGENFAGTVRTLKFLMQKCYARFRSLLTIDGLMLASERNDFLAVNRDMPDSDAKTAILSLSELIFRSEGKRPIILLDEYDTPLQEAWVKGYWEELADFMRGFFNATFKTNPYLERGLLTGITQVSKESIFSDLNNLKVVTTTSEIYADCFGFTEKEVFEAMDEYGCTEKEKVKQWYDGFIFGSEREIYNPWSIINYLYDKKFSSYWADSSLNSLVSELIIHSDYTLKEEMGHLLQGESIITKLDEQIVFSRLYTKVGAIWSLLMASGYVKPISFK